MIFTCPIIRASNNWWPYPTPHYTLHSTVGGQNANKNTKRTTQTWIRRFNVWRAERGISNALHEIPRENLHTILKRFFAKVVKENGDEYEPDCLKMMLACLDRHLKEHGASFSIRADQEFEESRKVLNRHAKEIWEIDQPMKAEALTEEEQLLGEKRSWRWRSKNAE